MPLSIRRSFQGQRGDGAESARRVSEPKSNDVEVLKDENQGQGQTRQPTQK